jgi:hypothetical protein
MRVCFFAVAFALAINNVWGSEEIKCPGTYGGHLQGIATDEERNIYWSFTVTIVKTDKTGKVLKTVKAPNHQGDLIPTCSQSELMVQYGHGGGKPWPNQRS